MTHNSYSRTTICAGFHSKWCSNDSLPCYTFTYQRNCT